MSSKKPIEPLSFEQNDGNSDEKKIGRKMYRMKSNDLNYRADFEGLYKNFIDSAHMTPSTSKYNIGEDCNSPNQKSFVLCNKKSSPSRRRISLSDIEENSEICLNSIKD